MIYTTDNWRNNSVASSVEAGVPLFHRSLLKPTLVLRYHSQHTNSNTEHRKMRTFFVLVALPLLASAWSEHLFLPRSTGNATSCDSGDQACGEFCIPANYTCCPDLEGGCSATSVCQKGENGVYGCCPKGDTCSGDGGAEYMKGSGSTSTSTAAVSPATKTSTSTSGAQPVVLSQGLAFMAVAAGLAAIL